MGKKTKICLHCQSIPDHVGAYTTGPAGPVAVKCIGLYRKWAGKITVGRPYVDQGQVDGYVMQGANGARAYWQRIREEVLKNKGLVDYWEPLNETSIWNASVAAGFVAFCQELTAIFHGQGLKIIIGGINTGWPRQQRLADGRSWLKLPDEDGGKQIMMIYNASKNADGVSFHEYWWYDSMVGGATLRYRYFHNHLKSKGLKHPPIWITECGVDRGNGIGWRTAYNNDERKYAQEIRKYAAEVQKDGYVVAVFMFTAGPQGWEDFNMTKGVCDNLNGELPSLPDWTYEDEPEPEPVPWGDPEDISKYVLGFDISQYQLSDFDWDAAVRAKCKFVLMRIGNGLEKDTCFERNWTEAGKRKFLRGVYQTVWPEKDGQAGALGGWLAGRKPELGVFGAHDMGGFDSERLARYFEAADRQTGGRVDLYSRKTLLDPLGAMPWGAGRRLWTAEWPAMPVWPTKPDKWEWGWEYWQFTNQGSIGGKRVDLNLYHGDLAAFRKKYGGQDPEEIEPENKPPVARFAAACTGLTCNFDASQSQDPDGTITAYDWNFGDGALKPSDGPTTSHSYAAGGTYDVTLTVTDDDGATDAEILTITVKEPEENYLEQAKAKLGEMAATIGELESQRKEALDLLAKVKP